MKRALVIAGTITLAALVPVSTASAATSPGATSSPKVQAAWNDWLHALALLHGIGPGHLSTASAIAALARAQAAEVAAYNKLIEAINPKHAVNPPKSLNGSTVVYTLSGNTPAQTTMFKVPANWDLNWSYNCGSQQGNFIVTLDGNDAQNNGTNILNLLSTSGKNIFRFYNTPGTHYISVDSTCNWSITVTD